MLLAGGMLFSLLAIKICSRPMDDDDDHYTGVGQDAMATHSRGGPKGINWLAVRTYVIEGHTLTDAAKRFKVSRQLVSKRASEEGWSKARDENTTAAKLQLDELTRQSRSGALALHADLADTLAQTVSSALSEIGEMKPGRGKAETIKTLADAADKAVRLSRDVRGIRTGEASTDEADEGDSAVRIVRQIVPASESKLA